MDSIYVLLASVFLGQVPAVGIENQYIPSVGSVELQINDGCQPQIPEKTTGIRGPGEIISQDCDLWYVQMNIQWKIHLMNFTISRGCYGEPYKNTMAQSRHVKEFLDVLDESSVDVIVDLDGGWGEDILNQRLDNFKIAASERYVIFGGVDLSQ